MSRDTLLIDEPLELVASGCEPGTTVEVTAAMETTNVTMRSSAALVAQADGTVDIGKQPSVGGSYSGVDPYGLWWSAAPAAAPDPHSRMPVVWRLRVSANGRSREHAVLALAYFGAPGLPNQLLAIKVETVARAIRWLHRRAELIGDQVAAIGGSRGGELALLAGSLLDRIGAVVALAPSHISWPGIDAGGAVDAPAWTFRGRPIPYAPVGPEPSSQRDPSTGAIVLRSAFAAVLEDPDSVRAAEIPVERIAGPILLIASEDDHFWPASAMATRSHPSQTAPPACPTASWPRFRDEPRLASQTHAHPSPKHWAE